MPPIQYFSSYNYSVFLMLHLFSISLGTSIQYFSCHLPTCLTLSCLVQCPHQLGRCHSIAPAPEYIHSYTQLSGSKRGDFYSVSWKHRQSYILIFSNVYSQNCPSIHTLIHWTQWVRRRGLCSYFCQDLESYEIWKRFFMSKFFPMFRCLMLWHKFTQLSGSEEGNYNASGSVLKLYLYHKVQRKIEEWFPFWKEGNFWSELNKSLSSRSNNRWV